MLGDGKGAAIGGAAQYGAVDGSQGEYRPCLAGVAQVLGSKIKRKHLLMARYNRYMHGAELTQIEFSRMINGFVLK